MTRRRPAPTTTTVPSGQRVHAQIVHAATWAQHHRQGLFITAAVLAVVAFVGSEWQRRRGATINRVMAPVHDALGGLCKLTVCHRLPGMRAVRFRDGGIAYLKLSYGDRARDYAHNPAVGHLKADLEERMGGPVSIVWGKRKGVVTIRLVEAPKPVKDDDGRIARAQDVARQLLGAEATVEKVTRGLDGRLEVFTVNHASIKDPDQEFRKMVDNTMQSKLGQRLQPQWEPHKDRVIYRAAATLPTFVPHPAPSSGNSVALPFGVDANGNHLAWNLDGITPHALFAGPTGSGKSNALRTVILEATFRGIETKICDGKQVSLLGLEHWPGVTKLALTSGDIARTILDTHAEMERRKAAIRERRAKPKDLPRLILVIDELWVVLQNLEEDHRAAGFKTTPPAVLAFRSLAREGREFRLHLLVGIQRPDAEITKGETRSNFGCRLIVGDSDIEIRRMMKLEKVTISDAVEGRGVTNAGRTKGERECQVYWSPDPGEYDDLSPADRVIIDGLRPPAPVSTIYPDRAAGTVQPRLHSSTQNASQPAEPLEVPAARILQLVPTELEPEPEIVPEPVATRYCRGCETEHPVTDFRDKESRCREFERRRQAAIRASKRGVPSR